MNRTLPPLKVKTKEAIATTVAVGPESATPFVPNPGGQEAFLKEANNPRTSFKWLFLRGGINSGKTTVGAAWFCERRRQDPEARSLITANSYPQLARSTLVGLAEYCQTYGIPLTPMESRPEETGRLIAARGFCHIWGAFVYVVSADSFVGGSETGRGMQVRDVWYDEGAYGSEGALLTLSGRFPRGPGSLKGLGVVTSSINKHDPYNFLYKLFDDPQRSTEAQRLYKSFKCSVRENPHIDPDFVPSLEAAYSDSLAKIEIDGDYAIISEGLVYPKFDRNLNNCTDTVQPTDALNLGMDFNIGKMASVVHVLRGGLPRAVDEFANLRDTPAMIEAIKERYPEHHQRSLISVYPDASGQYARSTTNASQSDVALLKQAGFRVVLDASNPAVKDRVNAMNAMFCNALGERRYLVNTAKCPVYTSALERQPYNDKGEPDKPKDDEVSHILDAAGYFIVKAFPIQQRSIKPAGIQVY